MKQGPEFSIITVSFNTRNIIEKTILSVIHQTYHNFEYLIIDGGSTDGTQEIIEKYKDKINYYISEKDSGLYDGMNKGILAASGDFVLFLNADDILANDDVLLSVAEFIKKNTDADIVYGNSEQVLEYGTYLVKPKQAYMNKKMAISHQATFVKRDLLLKHPFNLNYRFAADFEQLSSFFLDGYNFAYIDCLIARVEMRGGVTFDNHIKSAEEMYSIIESRGFDISKERDKIIRHKKMVRAFKQIIPRPIANMVFRTIAKYYKPL